jgi:SCO1/SenC
MEIVPVFISVDPERDTVEQIHDYVNGFSFYLLNESKKKFMYQGSCFCTGPRLILPEISNPMSSKLPIDLNWPQ